MLPTTLMRGKAGKWIPLVLAAMIMSACTVPKQASSPANVQAEATASSDYYLQQMQQSSDDQKTNWQLLAIRASLREGKLPQATQLLGSLPQNMTNVQLQEQQLLNAELNVAQKNFSAVFTLLGKLSPRNLSDAQQQRYYQAMIDASQGRPSLTLIRAYIAQEPLLPEAKAHQKNIDATWTTLTRLNQKDFSSLMINADENVLQGWLDLLRVYQDNRQDPAMLKAGIKDWQTRYPQNPAATTLPTQLDNILNFRAASTESIALILPMNGQAQVYANAIQAGFNDAKNGLMSQIPAPQPQAVPDAAPTQDPAAPAQEPAPVSADNSSDPNANGAVSPSAQPEAAPAETAPSATVQQQNTQPAPAPQPVLTPAPANAATQVRVYDSTSQPLSALLDQAQKDGATLVIGPLLKNDVDALHNLSTPLNVLALNQTENVQNNPNICYFALSPENEARDAAKHIWDQGKRAPLVLVPRGAFGDRVAKAFAAEWQALGGQTVLQQSFGSKNELQGSINGGGGIRLTGQPISVAPDASKSVTVAGLTIPAPIDPVVPATSNGRVDAAYIAATQGELTIIKPMIDLANGSHSGVALYASSRSYQAGAGPDFRLEMDGIQFSDIPLLSGTNPALMRYAAGKMRNDYSLVRLYAMGADAWSLANHFSQMRQIPGFQINGETGVLSADSNCVINRKLPWLQYRQGSIVPVQ